MAKKKESALDKLEKAAKAQAQEKYVLRLYVAGVTRKSKAAIESITTLCEQHLQGRYQLEIVDIYQQPGAASEDQIIAAPTLIKKLPFPLRRLIGNMMQKEKVLVGLDLRPKDE